jgi:hypothetical protein
VHTPSFRITPREPCVTYGIAVALALSFALVSPFTSVAWSQTIGEPLWAPDGRIQAIACTDRIVYVGGQFSVFAPYTGSGVVVSLGSAKIRPFPTLRAQVFAAVDDGAGGWFLGGGFLDVGGAPRHYLAHVLGNGRLADWAPAPDGFVRGLALRGGLLYVCGDFASIDGVTRHGVAAVDANTGAIADWNPDVRGGTVFAVALDRSTL